VVNGSPDGRRVGSTPTQGTTSGDVKINITSKEITWVTVDK